MERLISYACTPAASLLYPAKLSAPLSGLIDQNEVLEFMEAASLDRQADFFFEHGFAALPGAVAPGLLAEMQAAWTRKQAAMEPLWRQLVAEGATGNPRGKPGRFESRVSSRAFYMPASDFFSGPDGRTLLNVIALPAVVSLLERVVAPRPLLRCCGVQARTVVPQSADEVTGGYTNWRACRANSYMLYCPVDELSSPVLVPMYRRQIEMPPARPTAGHYPTIAL